MKTCLVVDDSHIVRRILRRIIEELQIEVLEAENGGVALEQCRQKMPDCVFMDWSMPVMDGIECVKNIRQQVEGDKPIVLFCTVETDPDFIEMAYAAGANDYIIKPIHFNLVQNKFQEHGITGQRDE